MIAAQISGQSAGVEFATARVRESHKNRQASVVRGKVFNQKRLFQVDFTMVAINKVDLLWEQWVLSSEPSARTMG